MTAAVRAAVGPPAKSRPFRLLARVTWASVKMLLQSFFEA
jgi:hypothetical protein